MQVFALKTCDTCRKAIKALTAAGHSVEVVDVRADGVPETDLRAILEKFGDQALNKASATWRGLSEAERESEPLAVLQTHPTAMKRPVIREGDQWTIGWKADVKSLWLGNS